jgi:hypothetical protein
MIKKIITPKEILKQLKEISTIKSIKENEYNTLNSNGEKFLEHRKVWERKFGNIPKGNIIHHKNGNKKDNRIENLECLTIKEHGLKHHKPNRIRIKYKSGIRVIKENL